MVPRVVWVPDTRIDAAILGFAAVIHRAQINEFNGSVEEYRPPGLETTFLLWTLAIVCFISAMALFSCVGYLREKQLTERYLHEKAAKAEPKG
jgi:hypothetical protein